MTDANPTLRQALAYAARGWPVFPCQPGQKTPATRHGYRDATTDPEQITDWFTRRPDCNLAIATGRPGPDVLDIDHHGPAGNGYPAYFRLREAGLAGDPAACICTPSGGMHAYYTGTDQHCGHLPGHHLDFRSAGGYVLAPPSRINGYPYVLPSPAPGHDLSHLGRWVAAQPEGNRNAGLYWAANRALETDPAADLGPLAAAARQAGLTDLEITRTLNSARRTTRQARPAAPSRQAEGVS